MKKTIAIVLGIFVAFIYIYILFYLDLISISLWGNHENLWYIPLALISFPTIGLLLVRKNRFHRLSAFILLFICLILPVSQTTKGYLYKQQGYARQSKELEIYKDFENNVKNSVTTYYGREIEEIKIFGYPIALYTNKSDICSKSLVRVYKNNSYTWFDYDEATDSITRIYTEKDFKNEITPYLPKGVEITKIQPNNNMDWIPFFYEKDGKEYEARVILRSGENDYEYICDYTPGIIILVDEDFFEIEIPKK